jgi:hypothetical protein
MDLSEGELVKKREKGEGDSVGKRGGRERERDRKVRER